ncbi:hypothetical protein [Aphanothece sacrum]|uniref:Secretion protein EccC n=1 Tax=Aphanothece sacrum FPU1 TaxID=1920663 RepID=A0A401IEU2_APHSA|nr:hypothetical protein [Aphanothece sacrum]GBF79700.1 secretion protein EccC [Aphanothece sacrum FPU1]GBF79715.1 secretion protein EccC [Aphanothece sacrum FPU1]GBF86304.1 secretion protein EccC [Aphanothece sacrum FPU3]GBF87161.1 secretion protein EccC [Aphanothece sacrum FPU3]
MNRETPFLIWTPPIDEDCNLDQELENLHQATELLDYALYTGDEFDCVLDCLNDQGQDPNAYLDYVAQNLQFLGICD